MLNSSMWWSLVRSAAKIAGGVLVAKGALSADDLSSLLTNADVIIGAATAIVPIAISLYTNTIGAKATAVQNAGGLATPPGGGLKALLIVPFLAIALVGLPVLGGCTTAPSAGTPTAAGGVNTPAAPGVSAKAQQTANTVNAAYAVVRGIAEVYLALTPCSTAGATKICQDPAVGLQLTKAVAIADTAVQQAVNAILTPTTDPNSISTWIGYATSAIGVLSQALVTFGVASI